MLFPHAVLPDAGFTAHISTLHGLHPSGVGLPALQEVNLQVSLSVSEGGQTSDSDAQHQREVSRLLLDFRPQGFPVPLESHVGGGKQSFSPFVRVARQVDAAQRHLPLPRHTPHLDTAREERDVTVTKRKSCPTCRAVRVRFY